MINTKFEVYKIKRELKRSGNDYEFTRAEVNKFGEPSGEEKVLGTLRGLYHEKFRYGSDYIEVTMYNAVQVRTRKNPSILCLYEDAASLALTIDDKVKVNGKVMKVTGVINIQEWNLIANISLEEIDNGV